MPISDWFTARDNRRYTKVSDGPSSSVSDMPDGVWIKCEGCKHALYEGELEANGRVCRHCGFHFDLNAPQRIEQLADVDSFIEFDAEMSSCDPLGFSAAKPYSQSLETAKERSGLSDAVIAGDARIEGVDVVLAAMDFRFIGASMGSVVGEKITRAFERATQARKPIVIVTASGGARMQEGMLSLMQMAKTSAAAQRHADAGLSYIVVLTNPTYGGVTASFAVLGDVIIAEPGAMVGFAGPRLVEQTIRRKLPKGFQTAEFMLEHGMIDEVVPRHHLREHLGTLLGYLRPVTVGGER